MSKRVVLSYLLAAILLLPGLARSAEFECNPMSLKNPAVQPGVETLTEEDQYMDLIRGKRVGLITNPTGVDSKLRSTVDILNDHPEVELVKLFGPEHGVRGDAYAGEKVEKEIDPRTGLPMYSLYGSTRRPPQEWLEGIDVMIYDMQDVGSRSYTYIYTMAYAMEECAKADIPFLVLDHPNPCGAHKVSGNILKPQEGTSFVGLYPIPYMYGLTPGETALLFNDNYTEVKCDLTVVPMRGYYREMLQWDTGLPFVPSSPNVPSAKTSFYYNLTGIIGELRSDVSIGVGYPLAFEIIAAPYIDAQEFVGALREKELENVLVKPITLKPFAASFEGETIHGAHFFISDFREIEPVEVQIHMMEVMQDLYPERGLWSGDNSRSAMVDKVLGTSEIRERIAAGDSAEDIIASYQDDVEEFMELRANYLLYPKKRIFDLEDKPLYEFDERDLDVYLGHAQEKYPDLRERVVHFGRKNLGQPYDMYLLGELPFQAHDAQPLYSLDRSDCVVFTEHSYAMALSQDWPTFFAMLQRIRYEDGVVSVQTRNHYTEADWDQNNSWLVQDISEELAGNDVGFYTQRVNRERFFKNRYGLDVDVPVEELEVSYVPWEKVSDISGQLRDGDFVNVIVGRGNGGAYATHTGLIAIDEEDGTVNFLHSTPPRVREEPIQEYIDRGVEKIEKRKEEEEAYLWGFKFLRLQDDPIANLRAIDGPDAPDLTFKLGEEYVLEKKAGSE